MNTRSRRRSRALTWVFLLLAAPGCGGLLGGSRGDGRDAATAFLDELRAGRIEAAWQGTTSEFKSLMGMEALRDLVKTHPALKGTAEYAESINSVRDGRAMVEHQFRAESRVRKKVAQATVRVLVASGDKGWAVERLSVE